MDLNKKIQRNINIYYLYSLFSSLIIIGPIITIYLFNKGLTFTQIMLLSSISSLAIVIFEVPTGALADKLGRKLSTIIGACLWALGLIILIIAKKFYIFAIGEIVFSLGMTFSSGADVALLYDSLKILGREKDFQQIEGRARSFSLYGQAIGSVVAGFVYKINIHLPLIISVIFMIITGLIAFNFFEVTVEHEKSTSSKNYFTQICESGNYILNHEKLKAIILYLMVFYVFYRGSFFLYQPYMQAVHIPVEFFGIIFFTFNIIAGLTSSHSHKIMKKTKPKTLMFLSSLMIISFLFLGLTKVWIGVAAIFFQQMARGLYSPVTGKYLNKNIPSDKRATILSFVSLLTNLAGAITYPVIGLIKDHTSIFNTHLILAGIMIILTFLTSLYMNKRLGVKTSNHVATEL